MKRAVKIELSPLTRKELVRISRSRSESVRLVERSKIVLLAARGLENNQIAQELNITRQKVSRWRVRFYELGIEGIAKDAPRPGKKPKISKRKKTQVVNKTLHEKPENATHWSRSSMSKATGLSESSIGRIWRDYGLKPHLNRSFKLSNDKKFVEKLEDVVGLYLNPPENAIVLSCDEKSQIQALDRTQPGLPLKKGRCGTTTHDYKRNGTTTLFAALNLLNGEVLGTCMKKHRHQEWIKFLNHIKKNSSKDKQVHIICDNYATHKHEKVQKWFERNKRFHVHFTPTSASWLNMVERFFRDISENQLKRGVFKSVEELITTIESYIETNNKNPKPFIWTAQANDILEKVKRGRAKLDKLQSV